jgi:predicted phage terminase large subunit-like protein
VNNRFETTIRNRVNSRNTPIVIIMQRLHEHDLCGYLQSIEPDDWTVLSLPCIYTGEDGQEKALWEHKHTIEELRKIEKANPFVFETQYMQNPTPIEGLMYRDFKTYEVVPYAKRTVKMNYTDTADTGEDYLCSICYDDCPEGIFVTDVLYTPKPMEYTEPKTAEMLSRNRTEIANVESNNGGRGFARNVEKHLRTMGNNKTAISWFSQNKNKQVRIFTLSADVNNLVHFPVGWETRWPEFYNALRSYRKEGRNAHDDAPDALTGCVEKRGSFSTADYTKEDLGIF